MTNRIRLKDKYQLARCCAPSQEDAITGYFSYDDVIKVHRADCENLGKAEEERLVKLTWEEILADNEFEPGNLVLTTL